MDPLSSPASARLAALALSCLVATTPDAAAPPATRSPGPATAADVTPAPAVPPTLPTVSLSIRQHALVAEVADTVAARTRGLMHRFSLKPDHGMLFVFPQPQPLAFWMRNTHVPLSIAFIDASGRILNIADMAPRTDDSHPSRGIALYALEMKKGWFAERGIVAGDPVRGLERVPPAKE